MTEKKGKAIWDVKIVRGAVWESFVKLHPQKMMGNPVMFVVEVGSVVTSVLLIRDALHHQGAFGFNSGVDHDTSRTEAYQQYLNYGQQQTVSDNILYSYAPIQSEIQMPQPTAYGVYRFA